jgi:hypothetical protein
MNERKELIEWMRGNIERMNERKDWENELEERLKEWMRGKKRLRERMRGKIERMNKRKDWENE